MGRVMNGSMRTRLQEAMAQLDSKYRAALKDDLMQEAFGDLWDVWSSEMGAMINSEVLSSLDLLLLTAAVDNRRRLMELERRLEGLGREDR
jgi:hypothetical protein